jgi:hypothetical protein
MNVFKQFFKSIYSPKDIAKFRFLGIGKTILYLFFLSLVSVIPSSYFFTTAINNGLEVTKATLKEEVPPFVIENGQLNTESSTPITIDKDGFKIIMDATGTVDSSEFENTDNVIALLKDEFVIVAGGQPQTTSYAMFSDIKITNKELLSFIETLEGFKLIFLPILILVIYIFSSGIKFIEVSILALIGLFITSLLSRNVPYRQLWRMAAFSVTLPTVFFMVMATLQTDVPNGFLINWFVSIIVLGLALKEVPMKKQKNQHS